MAVYSRQLSERNTNTAELSRLKRNLILAMREEVTPKQRQALLLYYADGLNMREIGAMLGVDKSTVSRTIKRGERRLQRCLRYGAEAYLRSLGP
jgi:RNA polymerase sigma factor (sigma-70 family)